MANTIVIPELEVSNLTSRSMGLYKNLIDQSSLNKISRNLEVWTSSASNKALAYHSHGLVRYFGKFPPPIARHLIQSYTKRGDLVIDPMCGSGTTALESLLLDRKAICFDINPLSVLLSKVKTTYVPEKELIKWLDKVVQLAESKHFNPWHKYVGLKNPHHWFLEETTGSLSKIKYAIRDVDAPGYIKDALTISWLGIVRRVSRATSQQGRLFLDIESAEKDALPFFKKKVRENAQKLNQLPKNNKAITIFKGSILEENSLSKQKAELLICHPPYFNNYKYSSVYSLELSWMDYDHGEVRKNEVREAFKIGKPEKVDDYLADMEKVLINCHSLIKKDGTIGLMIGDTVLRGQYIPVTYRLLKRVESLFKVEVVALRIPQFTEASWAASQRRLGDNVGVSLSDFVIVMKKV